MHCLVFCSTAEADPRYSLAFLMTKLTFSPDLRSTSFDEYFGEKNVNPERADNLLTLLRKLLAILYPLHNNLLIPSSAVVSPCQRFLPTYSSPPLGI